MRVMGPASPVRYEDAVNCRRAISIRGRPYGFLAKGLVERVRGMNINHLKSPVSKHMSSLELGATYINRSFVQYICPPCR